MHCMKSAAPSEVGARDLLRDEVTSARIDSILDTTEACSPAGTRPGLSTGPSWNAWDDDEDDPGSPRSPHALLHPGRDCPHPRVSLPGPPSVLQPQGPDRFHSSAPPPRAKAKTESPIRQLHARFQDGEPPNAPYLPGEAGCGATVVLKRVPIPFRVLIQNHIILQCGLGPDTGVASWMYEHEELPWGYNGGVQTVGPSTFSRKLTWKLMCE